jgi:hypothetical protein
MQGTAPRSPQNVSAHLQQKSEELTAEMQRLAREDEQLMRGLTRLAELNAIAEGEPPTAP